MILAVGYYQDVHLHDNDASDFSNVPRNLIASRLGLECTAFLYLKKLDILTQSTIKKVLTLPGQS